MATLPERIITIVNMGPMWADAFSIFTLPFMQRAFLAGTIAAILLGWIGVYMVSRRMSFIGDGIAHASLAGVALALLVGWAPLPVAMLMGIAMAAIIFIVERKTNIAVDAAVGIFFTFGISLGVILLHFYEGFQPELVSFLFGNILSITTSDLWFMVVVGTIMVVVLVKLSRQLTLMTVDPEGGYLYGLSRWRYDFLLYIMTAISVIASIKLVGIILVSALLIIPSAIAKLFTTSFASFRLLAIFLAALIMIIGLSVSYLVDLPSGATIVIVGTIIFALSSVWYGIRKPG